MARRQMNGLFLMTPYALLRMPEYGRFFDGASIGHLYRLILTGVRRQERKDLKFRNDTGWVTKLAELYENGKLASYFTMSDLREATGFTERRLADLIKTLEKIRLVKTESFSKGIIFIVGIRLTQNVFDGYSVGHEHEGLFIDEWETLAQKQPKKLAAYIVEELASPKQKEKFLRKIFPEGTKNFSENSIEETNDFDAPGQEISDLEENSSVDRVRIKDKMDSFESADLLSWAETEPASDILKVLKARLLSEPNWLEKVKIARQGMSEGMSLVEVNSLLARNLPEEFSSFSLYPRLGYYLASLKYSEREERRSPHIKMSNLWMSLCEDITGQDHSESSKSIKEARGFYKNILLRKYSYNQALWTLRNVILVNKSTADFVSKGWRNWLTVIEQNSAKYQAVLDARRQQKFEDVVQDERIERIKSIREQEVDPTTITNPWAKLYLNKEQNE